MATQDWDPLSKSMTRVLEQEARERALSRDAIATLRRRSTNVPTNSGGSCGAAPTVGTPSAASRARVQAAAVATAGQGKGVGAKGQHFPKRPGRRVRKLRSLPGRIPRQGPPTPPLLHRRETDPVCGISTVIGNGNGNGNGKSHDKAGRSGNTGVSTGSSGAFPPSSSSPCGAAGAGGGGDANTCKVGAWGAAFWPRAGDDGRSSTGQRRERGVPSGVIATDLIPATLSCGYCRKRFRAETLDQHEHRCPSRNPDLFSTPCVACGLQGPRCACWALRNGLLKETRTVPEKPLFALFKNARGDRAAAAAVQAATSTGPWTKKKAAGSLGGWAPGEALRRPIPLADQDGAGSSSCEDERGGGGCSGDPGSRGDEKKMNETAEQRWLRERDDWLFGRLRNAAAAAAAAPKTPTTPPRAPACDRGGSGSGGGGGPVGCGGGYQAREGAERQDGKPLFAGESDEVFLLRERMQMRSQLEKVRDAAKVRRYNEGWFHFSSDPPEKITHGDIPWLPRLSRLGGSATLFGVGGLRAEGAPCERFETLGVNEGDSSDLKKVAIRAASLRWHPDKFMSKYGPRIASEDRSKIVKDVQATMQRIIKLKERLYRQQDVDAKNEAHC